MSLPRRGAAWALTLGSLAALALLLLLSPPIRDYESFACQGEAEFAPYLAEHPGTLLAVRAPQLDRPFLSYDAASDTTLVRAGCGHQAGDTFRVRGRVDADPEPPRLYLHQIAATTPDNATPANTTSPTHAPGVATPTAPDRPPTPVPGLYAASTSVLPRMAASWLTLAVLAAGLTLLLTAVPLARAWLPPAGLLAGSLWAWWLQQGTSSAEFVVFLLGLPLLGLAAAGFGVAAFVARKRPARLAVMLALALLALGFLVQWFAFIDAFPSAPLA